MEQISDAQIDAMLADMERRLAPKDAPLTAWQKLGQTWPAQMAKNALSAVQAPGDAAANRFTRTPQTAGMWSDEDEAAQQAMDRARMERVTELAGGVMGGAYPMAQKGAVGIFGGRLAKTADQAALAKAEELAAKGAPREQIWKETGWFQGSDNKWRFEIPDNAAHLNKDKYGAGLPPLNRTRPITEDVTHSLLYEAYPQLRDAKSRVEKANYSGSYFGGDKPVIHIEAPDPIVGRSIALHELQHGVQQIENFSTGGNSSSFGDRLKELGGAIRTLNEKMKGVQGTPIYNQMLELRQQLVDQVNAIGPGKLTAKEKAFQAYLDLPGEREARNVQTRSYLSPEQRRAMPPWSTENAFGAVAAAKEAGAKAFAADLESSLANLSP